MIQSLDAWYYSGVGDYELSFFGARARFYAGPTAGSFLYSQLMELAQIIPYSWSKHRIVKYGISLDCPGGVDELISIANGTYEPFEDGIGFIITQNKIQGFSAADGVKTVIDLITGLVPPNILDWVLTFEYFPGNQILFYVNNVLKGMIDENFPERPDSQQILCEVRVFNQEFYSNSLFLNGLQIVQDQ